MPRISVVADQGLKGFLQSLHPNPLARVVQSHHASGDTLEEAAQSQGKAEDGVGDDPLFDFGASLALQNALQLCTVLQVFNDEDAFVFFAGDGGKTAHIDSHSFLHFELQAFQAFGALPLAGP